MKAALWHASQGDLAVKPANLKRRKRNADTVTQTGMSSSGQITDASLYSGLQKVRPSSASSVRSVVCSLVWKMMAWVRTRRQRRSRENCIIIIIWSGTDGVFGQVREQDTVLVFGLDLDSQLVVGTDLQELLTEGDVSEDLSLGHLEGDALLIPAVVQVQDEEGLGVLVEDAQQVVLGRDALVHQTLPGASTV